MDFVDLWTRWKYASDLDTEPIIFIQEHYIDHIEIYYFLHPF